MAEDDDEAADDAAAVVEESSSKPRSKMGIFLDCLINMILL